MQGAFAEHINALKKCNVETFEIRQKLDVLDNTMDGIILPGGESTVIGKLLKDLNLFGEIRESIMNGLPVLGTCAGMILMAKEINNDSNRYFGTMDITVQRNAYGRQLGSFQATGTFEGIGRIPMTFIRAPYITEVSKDKGVEILSVVGDNIVAARQKNMLAISFHPELTDDLRIHQYFLSMC